MNYQEIETFLTVLEVKSISAASSKLFISQGTASHRIQNLEKELGVQLFERHPGQKGLSLTNQGKEFHLLAKQWKALHQETLNLKHLESFTNISIAGIDIVNTFTLLPFYQDLINNQTNVKLKISTYHSNEIYELINKHAIDFGFTYSYSNYPNVQIEPLFSEPLVLVTALDSQLPDDISLSQLDISKEIYVNWGKDFEIWHDQHFQNASAKLVTAGNCHMQLALLDYPDSWAFIPKSILTSSTTLKTIRLITTKEPLPIKTCYKLTHKQSLSNKNDGFNLFSQKLDDYIKRYTS